MSVNNNMFVNNGEIVGHLSVIKNDIDNMTVRMDRVERDIKKLNRLVDIIEEHHFMATLRNVVIEANTKYELGFDIGKPAIQTGYFTGTDDGFRVWCLMEQLLIAKERAFRKIPNEEIVKALEPYSSPKYESRNSVRIAYEWWLFYKDE